MNPEEIAKLTYTLAHKDIQGILNYLATRPYAEVYKLVDTLRSIQPNNPSVLTSEVVDVTPPLVENNGQEKTGQA